MEVQIRKSRKRKQPASCSTSSTPFAGVLTRRKSQKFFFHHTRSGNSRKSRTFPSSLTNPNSPTNQRLLDSNHRNAVGADADEDDEIYNISIKDLRARRVFSKPPKSEDAGKVSDDKVGKNVNPNTDSKLIVSKLDEVDGKSDGNGTLSENSSLSITEKGDTAAALKGEGLNDRNPNLLVSVMCVDSGDNLKEGSNGGNPNSSLLEKCVDSRVDSKGERLNGGNPNLPIDGFSAKDECQGRISDDMSPNVISKDLKGRNGEDCGQNVQTTPPDAVVIVRQSCTTPPDAVVLVRQSDEHSVLQSRSAGSRLSPKLISPCNGGSAEGKKSFPNSKRNLMGLNLCSRLKVYKTPNSFSYRRLLPYLMDLAKDTPSAPKVNSNIKIETDVEVPLSTEAICQSQEVNTYCKEEERPTLDLKSNDTGLEQAVLSSPIECLVEKTDPEQAVLSTPINCPLEKTEEHPVFDESQIETPISDDFNKNGGSLPDTQASSDDAGESGHISPIIESDLAITLHSPKSSPEPSREDATLRTPSPLSVSAERESKPALVELKCEESMFHSLPKQEAIVSSCVSGFGHAQGILKRNPRGCRGICNCLNCASFRLNAEKAFEFSRNQLFDAEELATDLLTELSSMRCMLENSVNGTNDNAVVPIDQVQEVCRRASDAEEIARNRLNQMNEDLHVHCRIKPLERPRVTFSSPVQKKLMRGTNPAR